MSGNNEDLGSSYFHPELNQNQNCKPPHGFQNFQTPKRKQPHDHNPPSGRKKNIIGRTYPPIPPLGGRPANNTSLSSSSSSSSKLGGLSSFHGYLDSNNSMSNPFSSLGPILGPIGGTTSISSDDSRNYVLKKKKKKKKKKSSKRRKRRKKKPPRKQILEFRRPEKIGLLGNQDIPKLIEIRATNNNNFNNNNNRNVKLEQHQRKILRPPPPPQNDLMSILKNWMMQGNFQQQQQQIGPRPKLDELMEKQVSVKCHGAGKYGDMIDEDEVEEHARRLVNLSKGKKQDSCGSLLPLFSSAKSNKRTNTGGKRRVVKYKAGRQKSHKFSEIPSGMVTVVPNTSEVGSRVRYKNMIFIRRKKDNLFKKIGKHGDVYYCKTNGCCMSLKEIEGVYYENLRGHSCSSYIGYSPENNNKSHQNNNNNMTLNNLVNPNSPRSGMKKRMLDKEQESEDEDENEASTGQMTRSHINNSMTMSNNRNGSNPPNFQQNQYKNNLYKPNFQQPSSHGQVNPNHDFRRTNMEISRKNKEHPGSTMNNNVGGDDDMDLGDAFNNTNENNNNVNGNVNNMNNLVTATQVSPITDGGLVFESFNFNYHSEDLLHDGDQGFGVFNNMNENNIIVNGNGQVTTPVSPTDEVGSVYGTLNFYYHTEDNPTEDFLDEDQGFDVYNNRTENNNVDVDVDDNNNMNNNPVIPNQPTMNNLFEGDQMLYNLDASDDHDYSDFGVYGEYY